MQCGGIPTTTSTTNTQPNKSPTHRSASVVLLCRPPERQHKRRWQQQPRGGETSPIVAQPNTILLHSLSLALVLRTPSVPENRHNQPENLDTAVRCCCCWKANHTEAHSCRRFSGGRIPEKRSARLIGAAKRKRGISSSERRRRVKSTAKSECFFCRNLWCIVLCGVLVILSFDGGERGPRRLLSQTNSC